MGVSAAQVVRYVARMTEFADLEDDGVDLTQIKFRGPKKLKDDLEQLALVQQHVWRLKKKKGTYSSNKLINFIVGRWVRGWVSKFGAVPTTDEEVRKAAEATLQYEERAAKKK
jgi:hypothetical protein